MNGLTRRALLFGRLGAAPRRSSSRALPALLLRPPGAVAEPVFVERCRDCEACLAACPAGVIRKVDAPGREAHDTAYVDVHRGGCRYCDDFPCIAACIPGALSSPQRTLGTAQILAHCLTLNRVECGLCLNACPGGIQAIQRQPGGRIALAADACVGCGRCLSRCFLSPPAIGLSPAPQSASLSVPTRQESEATG